MTASPDQPSIFGRTPTGTGIIAAGLLIAIIAGVVGVLRPNAVGRIFETSATLPLVVSVIAILFISAGARIALRRSLSRRPADWVYAITFYKIANLFAIVVLGIAAFTAFVLGSPFWPGLVQGIVIVTLLSLATSIVSTIGFNIVALISLRRAA